jgi:hypothetical protein
VISGGGGEGERIRGGAEVGGGGAPVSRRSGDAGAGETPKVLSDILRVNANMVIFVDYQKPYGMPSKHIYTFSIKKNTFF